MACGDARRQVILSSSPLSVQSDRLQSQRLGTSPLVTLDLPSALSPRVMNALQADPRTVDLRSQATHFYALAGRILDLFEEEEMVDILSDVGSLFQCLERIPARLTT